MYIHIYASIYTFIYVYVGTNVHIKTYMDTYISSHTQLNFDNVYSLLQHTFTHVHPNICLYRAL